MICSSCNKHRNCYTSQCDQNTGYITDSLYSVYSFQPDYQSIAKSTIKTLNPQRKERNFAVSLQYSKSLHPIKYKGYSDFILLTVKDTSFFITNKNIKQNNFSLPFLANGIFSVLTNKFI